MIGDPSNGVAPLDGRSAVTLGEPVAESTGKTPPFESLFGIGILAARTGLPGYSLSWFPATPVSGQPTDLGFIRQELSIFTPVDYEGPDTATIGMALRNSMFNTNAILPNSKRRFPDALWDIGVGLAYSHKFPNAWTGGVVVNAGSASDRPFSQGDVLNASIAMYLTMPAKDDNFWVAGFLYSPVAEFPYPIPSLSYFLRAAPELEVNIGLPFLLRWRPYEDVRVDMYYLPIHTVSIRASWEFVPESWVFAAFDWANESYFLADRANNSDRLMSYEKRLTGGLQFELGNGFRLDLSAGYAFDRFYFQGRRYADRTNDLINVGAGLFGTLQIRFQF